jgi:hypothetical protein
MRKSEFTAMQSQHEFVQLQEGLGTNATGRLSSVLIPPHSPSKILQKVALRLPHDISLLAGVNMDNTYLYYDVSTVQAYATSKAIRLVTCSPLREADRIISSFKSMTMPIYSEALGRPL